MKLSMTIKPPEAASSSSEVAGVVVGETTVSVSFVLSTACRYGILLCMLFSYLLSYCLYKKFLFSKFLGFFEK